MDGQPGVAGALYRLAHVAHAARLQREPRDVEYRLVADDHPAPYPLGAPQRHRSRAGAQDGRAPAVAGTGVEVPGDGRPGGVGRADRVAAHERRAEQHPVPHGRPPVRAERVRPVHAARERGEAVRLGVGRERGDEGAVPLVAGDRWRRGRERGGEGGHRAPQGHETQHPAGCSVHRPPVVHERGRRAGQSDVDGRAQPARVRPHREQPVQREQKPDDGGADDEAGRPVRGAGQRARGGEGDGEPVQGQPASTGDPTGEDQQAEAGRDRDGAAWHRPAAGEQGHERAVGGNVRERDRDRRHSGGEEPDRGCAHGSMVVIFMNGRQSGRGSPGVR